MEHFVLLVLFFLSIASIDSFQIRSIPCHSRIRTIASSSSSSSSIGDQGKLTQINVSFNDTANIPIVYHEVWRLDRRNQIQHGINVPLAPPVPPSPYKHSVITTIRTYPISFSNPFYPYEQLNFGVKTGGRG